MVPRDSDVLTLPRITEVPVLERGPEILPQAAELPPAKPARLVSLDAYRGFVMLAMASGGLGLARVAAARPDNPGWQFLGYEFDHVAWTGCAFWDLIQPSFMFMVGVAMPYSIASRRAAGASEKNIFAHVLLRSLILTSLGVFLSSNGSRFTDYTFVNVLTQIGLGYTFLYLLVGRGWKVQLLGSMAVLAGYWLWFFLHPLPGALFDYARAGNPGCDELFASWFAHWDKNTNAAADFDVWFLNLFPRPTPFVYNRGGYQTLNFVPSLATMIFGLMAGEFLRTRREPADKLRTLAWAGAVCLLLGGLLGLTICPIVKRIWTPSWAIFSTGWTLWMLAGFFWLIDVKGYRRWSLPLVVVGMNSIAMYCMAQLMKGWVRQTLKTHFGQHIFDGLFGETILASLATLFVLWLFCLWLYRQKIFVRI